MHQGRSVKTHLSAWIDCHSRYIVEARYYVRENLDILLDSLLRAWGNHGASRELYVDNAKIYHAKALQLTAGRSCLATPYCRLRLHQTCHLLARRPARREARSPAGPTRADLDHPFLPMDR